MYNKNNDELSDLLDSFQADDTMERKMNDFARQKETKSRMQRTQKKETIRIQPEEPRVRISKPVEPDQGETVVFNKVNVEQNAAATEGTVMMDDKEIQSLLNENKGPQVRTEKAPKGSVKPPHKKKKPANDNAKKIGMIIAAVVGILLVALLAFGIFKAVMGGFKDSEEKQQENFDRIVEFLDEEDFDLARVRKFKELYDRLSEEMQEEINDEIYTITRGECSDFDELLDKAKEDKRKEDKKKKDKKDETTKIAERKAEIKEEIAKLKKRLAKLGDSEDLSNEVSKAKQSYEDLSAEEAAIQAEFEQLNISMQEIENINAQLEALKKGDGDGPAGSGNVSEETQAQIDALEAQYHAMISANPSLKADWKKAQKDLEMAQSKTQKAYDKYSKLQSEYDANASDNEAEKQSIQAQIDELEEELRELNRK